MRRVKAGERGWPRKYTYKAMQIMMHAQNNSEIVIRQDDTLVDIQTYGFVAVHADTVLAVRCRKLNEYLEILADREKTHDESTYSTHARNHHKVRPCRDWNSSNPDCWSRSCIGCRD